MEFPGFSAEDFDVFSIPDFAARMGAIRAEIRPKLIALGTDLRPGIEEIVAGELFPHAAQHTRRRVNPPPETWVAFARDRKGYKRWTHYRVAISGEGIRVTVFVEDDADDKPRFAASLRKGAGEILSTLGPGAPLLWYSLDGDRHVPHASVTVAALKRLGGSLKRLKTARFQAGVPLPRGDAAKAPPARFEEWVLDQVRVLKPLYLAGAADDSV